MAKYIITRINKSSKRTKVAKERVEVKIWPLLVCFFLAFCVWLYIAGDAIRREEHGDPASDGYAHVERVPGEGHWDMTAPGAEDAQPGAST